MSEMVYDASNPGQGFVSRANDPVTLPQPYVTPIDFLAQFPTPLDPLEIIAMCEEVTLWRALPTSPTGLKYELWRELNELAFTSGASYVSFADGGCPEEYYHDGDNTTVTLKNIGAKKSLSISDILHSQASSANGGIQALLGGHPAGAGLPGAADAATFVRSQVADLKQKEIRLAETLVLNHADRLLVEGNASSNSLEWNGIENWAANMSCTMHTNVNTASGTFSANTFDRYLSEACAKPTHLLGHPQAIQEVMGAYFQLGWQGAQTINVTSGDRVIPGFNFGGSVRTGIGLLTVIADSNFNVTDMGNGAFQARVWAMRFTHNGEPFVYRSVQIPLALKDLAPGCTAVSFQVWEKSALIIKNCCAQGNFVSQYSGRQISTCVTIY